MEARFITTPLPASFITGNAYLVIRKMPLTLTEKILSHKDSGRSSIGIGLCGIPALLKSMSILPNLSLVALIRFSALEALETSAWTKIASPPLELIAATVSFPPASLMSATTILAPSLANKIADARPNPEPAPVIMATLLANLILSSFSANLNFIYSV